MLYRVQTDKTVTDAANDLQKSINANNFGVLNIHNFQETMHKKGVEFPNECLVFEICNANQAKKVLDANMAVSTALPCRISVYKEKGQTIIATLKPSVMLSMFDIPELADVAQEVEDSIIKIISEAIE